MAKAKKVLTEQELRDHVPGKEKFFMAWAL